MNDELVKNQILVHAQKLFMQYGLKKTTMDEIASACGKAKSTLYHYFKSKEDVFNAVVNLELRNLRIIVKKKTDSASTTKEKIAAYFLEFHKELTHKINLYRIVKHELSSKALADEYFNRIMRFETYYVARILEDGYDIGEFISVEKKDIAWTAELLVAAFFGIVRYSVENGESFDQEKLKAAADNFVPKLIQ